jgi:DNA-binding GntR family transcriptional regulator
MAVETGAAQVLAGREPPAGEVERLRECLRDADQSAPADYRRLDTRFHLTSAS